MKNPSKTNRMAMGFFVTVLAGPCVFGAVILGTTNHATACDDDPSFRITTRHDRDKVAVTTEKDKVVLSVQSPTGIGQAVIGRRDDKWPATVILRLHLKGLEWLQVVDGKKKLEATVSSQDGKVRIWQDGKEDLPLDSEHRSWMDIRMFGKDREPERVIPLIAGHFEMQLPKALLEDNPESITIQWIDFYR